MLKFFNKRFWRHAGDQTPSASVADLRGKFYLDKHCAHGFPLGPSCMTFDPHRKCLFIGTSTGELRMLGQPGVELTGIHDDVYTVLQILPFASEPSLITICSNNVMHKWGLMDGDGNARLVLKRTYKFQGGLAKTITTCCLPPYCDCLFVGTLGGITYPMDTEFDGMSPEVLSWSRARAYLKYKGKDVPGCVKTLDISPANPKQLLIGYDHNYLELWDALTWKPISIYGPVKEDDLGDILATTWHSSGTQFLTSHQTGEISFWNLSEKDRPFMIRRLHENSRVQPMTTVLWPSDSMQVISGGAPTDMVDGDSVTIVNNNEIETLQLSSPVKGMHVLEDQQADRDSGIVNYSSSNGEGAGSTTSRKILVLLLEQEILFIELTFPDFPILKPPYLYSLHNSPVKAVQVYSDVSKEVLQTISQVGRVQLETVYSAQCKVWPIDGGIMDPPKHDNREILISGHEDGTVKFWDIKNSNMYLLYVIRCSDCFISRESDFFRSSTPDSDAEEEEKQPKHIGFWDPRSDDDQIQVSCIQFYEDKLLVGIEAGMTLLFAINNQSGSAPIQHHRVSIMRDDPRQRGRNFQAPMDLRTDIIESPPGFQPRYCVGVFPKVPITAVALAKDHGMIGVGCMYGFTIVDYTKNQTIHVHCTHNEASPEQGGALSRMQSIRKSFRQSLKRFDVRRSMRGLQSTQRSFRPNLQRAGSTRPSMKNRTQGGAVGGASNDASVETTPIPPRRDIVKTISFTAPVHIGGHSKVHSILVGTNQGSVLGYTVDMPSGRHRDTRSPIVMPVEREFNAKRNLPVLFAGVVDQQNYLLDINDQGSYHSSSKGTQYLVIVTEEGLKVGSLPNMKKKHRVKLKQNDADLFHLVSAHYVRVAGYSAILTMGSDGNLTVFSLPDLKLIYKEDCVDSSDAIGQRNFTMARNGTLLHQRSPSEFTRGSITEDARLEFHFSLPSKHVSPLMLTPNTPKSTNGEPIFEVTHIESPRKSVGGEVPSPPQPPPATEEVDLDEVVKSKETPQIETPPVVSKEPPQVVKEQQFQFDVGSPQSLKEYQERAL